MFVVDPVFRDKFHVAKTTPAFASLWSCLPEVFVGTAEQLVPLVQLVCGEVSLGVVLAMTFFLTVCLAVSEIGSMKRNLPVSGCSTLCTAQQDTLLPTGESMLLPTWVFGFHLCAVPGESGLAIT